jgi:L-threonylcarbamoyladenylate synthase
VATAAEISLAVEVLAQGGLVAVPTETVYGLAADALNPDAVRRIFELKGRPTAHPLIVHLPAPREPSAPAWRELLERWAVDVPPLAVELASEFWPGPLTLILRRAAHVPDEVTGELDTVGLRVPGHPVAQALLAGFAARQPESRTGLAAPSANRFGHISPTTAQHVQDEFGASLLPAQDLRAGSPLPQRVAGVILDGGPAEIGIESTIIDLSQGWLRILRPGAIGLEQLHAVMARTPESELRGTGLAEAQLETVRAPGMLDLHYAPRAELRLIEEGELAALLEASRERSSGLHAHDDVNRHILSVSAAAVQLPPVAIIASRELLNAHALPRCFLPIRLGASLQEQARGLYAALRQADAEADLIYAVLPPQAGIGIAIRDRLRRAAGRGESPL